MTAPLTFNNAALRQLLEQARPRWEKILLIVLLVATPATAGDNRLSATAHGLSRQLSMIDSAYRMDCISRRERDSVWDAAESYAEVAGMNWERIRRSAKSNRALRPRCGTARGLVGSAYLFNNTAE